MPADTSDRLTYATADLFHAEVARLQAEIERLRLTDAEREAVKWAVSAAEDCQHPADDPLRGLLERTK